MYNQINATDLIDAMRAIDEINLIDETSQSNHANPISELDLINEMTPYLRLVQSTGNIQFISKIRSIRLIQSMKINLISGISEIALFNAINPICLTILIRFIKCVYLINPTSTKTTTQIKMQVVHLYSIYFVSSASLERQN